MSLILEGEKYITIETEMNHHIPISIVISRTIQIKLVLNRFHFRWLNIFLSIKELRTRPYLNNFTFLTF